MKRYAVSMLLLISLVGLFSSAIAFGGSSAAANAPLVEQGGGTQNGKCSLNTIKGTYAARIGGWVGAGASRRPYSDVGFLRADGRGNLAGASTFSVDGVIGSHDIAGTYTVDPDTCTGEAVTTIGTFFFVIADNGKLSRIIATTPGMTVDGEGIRQ